MGEKKSRNCNELISRYELLQELHRRDQDDADVVETINDMTPKGIEVPDQSNNIVVMVDVTPMTGKGFPMAPSNNVRFLATLEPFKIDRLGLTANYAIDIGEKHVVLHRGGNKITEVCMGNNISSHEIEEESDEKQSDTHQTAPNWVPKDGDHYYFLNECNIVDYDVWSSNNFVHKARLMARNCFRYKKDGAFEMNRRNVYNRLMDFGRPFIKDPYEPTLSYFISYDFLEHRITVFWTSSMNMFGDVYFESEAKALEALNDVGVVDFLKYYLGVPAIEIAKNRARIDESVKELNERYGNH